MSETDKYYIERCLDGHPDDFRYIVRRYQAVLLAHLAGKLGNKDKAEEAAQKSLVRAYFNMNKLRRPGSFFSWLLGIADRVAKEQKNIREKKCFTSSGKLSVRSRRKLPVRNCLRITGSRRQLPSCLKATVESFCCDITAAAHALR